MTEQEHTITLVVGLLNAASHMLDAGREGKDATLDGAMDDAREQVQRARRTLSRTLSKQLLARTGRDLSSDLREDR